jgi:hypothetical protein
VPLKRTQSRTEPSMCGGAVTLPGRRLKPTLLSAKPGGLEVGWVLEGLDYYAELFGFFL